MGGWHGSHCSLVWLVDGVMNHVLLVRADQSNVFLTMEAQHHARLPKSSLSASTVRSRGPALGVSSVRFAPLSSVVPNTSGTTAGATAAVIRGTSGHASVSLDASTWGGPDVGQSVSMYPMGQSVMGQTTVGHFMTDSHYERMNSELDQHLP
jgi:hypothetical protein